MTGRNEGEGPRVLVVEDEPDLADLYALWMEDSYVVEIANDRSSAYWRFDERVDVVLLDRNLPDGPGDEVLETIRELGFDTRVAMVTAQKPTMDTLAMAFDDYVSKPVSREELLETVERLVDLQRYKEAVTEAEMLARKKELAEAHFTEDELASSARYARIVDRLAELQGVVGDAGGSTSAPSAQTEQGSVRNP